MVEVDNLESSETLLVLSESGRTGIGEHLIALSIEVYLGAPSSYVLRIRAMLSTWSCKARLGLRVRQILGRTCCLFPNGCRQIGRILRYPFIELQERLKGQFKTRVCSGLVLH